VLVLVLVIVIDLSIIRETGPAMRLRNMLLCTGLKDTRILEHEREREGVAPKLELP